MPPAPAMRVRALNRALNLAPENPGGAYVLYWMTMQRRPGFNFALEHAAAAALRLGRPLVVLEALRLGHAWASDRLHAFILQGMAANAAAFAAGPALYHPFVETTPGAGKGLLAALAKRACLVVADDWPCFFLPRMLTAAARQVEAAGAAMVAVDSCGLMPLAATEREYPSAYVFRRFLQKTLPGHLAAFPAADPLAGLDLPRLAGLAEAITRRWPAAPAAALAAGPEFLAGLAIDHGVPPASARGGFVAGGAVLRKFIAENLPRYLERNHPDAAAASGLGPWLHFGHVSAHEVFAAVVAAEKWSPARLGVKANGKREGWWGMSPAAEAFLDQLVTWRELGFNCCARRPDYDQYASLPAWARATLEAAAGDRRPYTYRLDQLDRAATHDELWNAAQRELVATGVMHNYLRMLWGKKILEWSPTPQAALAAMIALNNRHALDGRDPNSYSGIGWVLGRYDRPFARRPVFGQVRCMTSDSARRKLRLKAYLARWAGGRELAQSPPRPS
ncbi:MAG: deoxyribodipyrimidine photolyase [Pseudomonadota bacterium]